MSDEFLVFHFPCKDCLVRAVCQEKPNISDWEEKQLYERKRTHCFTVPHYEKTKHYHKMLIECWANMAPMIANAMPVVGDEKEYCKEMNIPLSFAINMRIIGGIFQYMVNSTSWREGKLLDFDKHELNSKMKGIKF